MVKRVAKPHKLTEREKKLVELIGKQQKSVLERFPLIFTLLGSFGLVATFYGFESVIDEVAIFRDNPYLLLGTGLVILILTGSLYKKLQ